MEGPLGTAPLAHGVQISDQGRVGVVDLQDDLFRHFAVGRASFLSRFRRLLDAYCQGPDYHMLYGLGDLFALGPGRAHAKNFKDFFGRLLGADIKIFAHVLHHPQCGAFLSGAKFGSVKAACARSTGCWKNPQANSPR